MAEMYEKPKKILVPGTSGQVVAHQLADNHIELVRQDQKIIITGNDFSVMATSPKHVDGKNVYTTITATDGKIDEDDIEYKPEKTEEPPEGKKFKLDDDGEKVLDDEGQPVLEDAETNEE